MTRRSTCPSGGAGPGFDRIQDECRWLAELAGSLAGGRKTAPGGRDLRGMRPHFAAIAAPMGLNLGIPVNSLAESWKRGRLVSACPKCGGTSYVMGAVANSFRGRNRWFGLCPECRAAVAGKRPGAGMLWRLALAWARSIRG